MPGHTSSIGDAYPDYIACKGLTPWGTYANVRESIEFQTQHIS